MTRKTHSSNYIKLQSLTFNLILILTTKRQKIAWKSLGIRGCKIRCRSRYRFWITMLNTIPLMLKSSIWMLINRINHFKRRRRKFPIFLHCLTRPRYSYPMKQRRYEMVWIRSFSHLLVHNLYQSQTTCQ